MSYSVIIFVIFFGVLLNTAVIAQTSSATVSATIVQPISLLKVRDMNFGNISAGTTGGKVVLDPNEAGTRGATGSITLPSGSSTVSSAKFIVSGMNGSSYTIGLPPAALTLSNGTNFMTVDNFTSTPSATGTFTPGSQTICVGATLNVNANQESGVYQSTENFEINVNYN